MKKGRTPEPRVGPGILFLISYLRYLRRTERFSIVLKRTMGISRARSPQLKSALLKIPPCEPLKPFIEARRTLSLGNRVKWKELAELLKVPFAPEICHEWYRKNLDDTWCWPRLLSGPADGKLQPDECAELVSLLVPFTNSEECFFRFSDIPFFNSDEPKLFRGVLNEVCGFLEGRRFGFEYWWPPDQSWCVCSDYDLHFSVVAGPRTLVSALLASSVLECIEITPENRIDVFAPMPPNPVSNSPA